MTRTEPGVLYVVVCAAGPAPKASRLVDLSLRRGWDVQIIATPAALEFIDVPALEALTARPVRSDHSRPAGYRTPAADAVIVAPATFNTINKWAQGIADSYAHSLLAELPGLGTAAVALPFVNTALADRRPFRHSVEQLRAEGVEVLLGPDALQPHPPRTGKAHIACFPWALALDTVERPRHRPRPGPGSA